MRQRLGVARCLLSNPELLILDEPMNGLDPGGMLDMRRMIRALVEEEGRTVGRGRGSLPAPGVEARSAAAVASCWLGAGYVNFLGEDGQGRIRAAYGPDTYRSARGGQARRRPGQPLSLYQNIPPAGW